MKTISVTKAASKGIVMGKAFLVVQQNLEADKKLIRDSEKEIEVKKFEKAVKDTVADLQVLAKDNEIFAAHMDVASDPDLHDSVVDKINNELKNAQLALEEYIDATVEMFENLDDEYLRERAADMKDVGKRIMCHLKGIRSNPFEGINEETIVIAEDLAPSDTANMDFKFVRGFITEGGGVTSHVAIMARNREIPAIVGVAGFRSEVTNNDYIILDALGAKIIINPDERTKQEYIKKAEEYKEMKAKLESMNGLPATTVDGRTVELFANIGNIPDAENAVAKGAEGVGLFRSEFLYMENTKFPTEEEQFTTYKAAVETLKKPVIIRTLDIGGDKAIPYLGLKEEENPFLGFRAIRFCLQREDIYKIQLRALIRASAFGKIKIMVPLVTCVDELRRVKEMAAEIMQDLDHEGITYNKNLEIGVMMETSAACMIADILAKEAAFFSIGTNDLTGYTMAVDRGNAKVAYLYSTYQPAVLRSIKRIIECGKREGIMVGMCGEAAADPKLIPLLLAFGLDEFSVSATSVLKTRKIISGCDVSECQELADKVMKCTTEEEILNILK